MATEKKSNFKNIIGSGFPDYINGQIRKRGETLFNKNGAGVINCEVDDSYVKKLLGYFKQR